MILSKKYENKYIKYKSKYLKIKNLIQKGGIIPHTLPLSLLAIDKSYFGMLVWMQLCNLRGVALFSFVSIPQRVPRPFACVRVYDMSLTSVERLRIVGCGLKGKLVQQLSLGVGHHFEPQSNLRACHHMMFSIANHIASKKVDAVRKVAAKEAAKEADKFCALVQFAAALVPLQRAIDFGHFPSRAFMAMLLIEGREGVAKNVKRGFELAEEGVRLGCHHCQGVMAYCYCWGHGCEADEARLLELARESSGRGSRYGQLTLGKLHCTGGGGLRRDNAQALAFYRLAAAQGLDGAQYSLGGMYYHGYGVSQDYAEALRLYQLAAAQGYPQALYRVAECHERGHGVAADAAEAIRWYRRAQAAGHHGATAKLQRLGA